MPDLPPHPLAGRVVVAIGFFPWKANGNRKWCVLLDGYVIAERLTPVTHAEACAIAAARLAPAPGAREIPYGAATTFRVKRRSDGDDFGGDAA